MLTVLMATHNGATTLPRVLNSYCQLVEPAGGWRLVVVDNVSVDATGEILAGFAGSLPITPVRIEKRGKNVALNVGLDLVDGDLVVFTDDDAIVDRQWLVRLRQVADQQADFDVFGGRIDPVWPDRLPEWIPRVVNLGATYAITPRGLRSGPVSASQVWGANMAIRTSVFLRGHRFNEAVGPSTGQYMMGSELELTCRIERLGHKAWFVEDAQVGHIIRSHQLDRQWIIKRAYRLGRHMFHQEIDSIPRDVKMLRGAPRWKYRELIAALGNSLRCALARDDDGKFLADWQLSFLRGYLAEAGTSTQARSHGALVR
ncbi:glycosyltransferase [Rhodocyclus purpureus]|uniref:glycosyltransferase n=1 Tax=Rhodocyclus purpureus TaxID=1067 RepID=UPI0019127EF9|nr:glycosyltransferase [Rhodocyclus purpureus]